MQYIGLGKKVSHKTNKSCNEVTIMSWPSLGGALSSLFIPATTRRKCSEQYQYDLKKRFE